MTPDPIDMRINEEKRSESWAGLGAWDSQFSSFMWQWEDLACGKTVVNK